MKLREALTVIFVTSIDCDYYELLLRSDITTLQPGTRLELTERMREFY